MKRFISLILCFALLICSFTVSISLAKEDNTNGILNIDFEYFTADTSVSASSGFTKNCEKIFDLTKTGDTGTRKYDLGDITAKKYGYLYLAGWVAAPDRVSSTEKITGVYYKYDGGQYVECSSNVTASQSDVIISEAYSPVNREYSMWVPLYNGTQSFTVYAKITSGEFIPFDTFTYTKNVYTEVPDGTQIKKDVLGSEYITLSGVNYPVFYENGTAYYNPSLVDVTDGTGILFNLDATGDSTGYQIKNDAEKRVVDLSSDAYGGGNKADNGSRTIDLGNLYTVYNNNNGKIYLNLLGWIADSNRSLTDVKVFVDGIANVSTNAMDRTDEINNAVGSNFKAARGINCKIKLEKGRHNIAVAVQDANGIYEIRTYKYRIEAPLIEGISASLESSISLKFKTNLPAGAAVKVEKDGKECSFILNDDGYVVVDVAAKEMTDDVTITVADSETGDEDTYTTTVKDYANLVINGDYNEGIKAVCEKLLIYGAMAQLYFEHNTDKLASSGVPSNNLDSANIPATYIGSGIIPEDISTTYYGVSLLLKSRIKLRLYYDGGKSHVDRELTPGELPDALNYCKLALESPESTDALKNVCRAIYDLNKQINGTYYIAKASKDGMGQLVELCSSLSTAKSQADANARFGQAVYDGTGKFVYAKDGELSAIAMAEAKWVADYIRTNGFKYGDAPTNPAINCDAKTVSCDRFVGWVLYRMGYTDQPTSQGLVVYDGTKTRDFATWCEKHGFRKITDVNDIKAGDVVFVTLNEQHSYTDHMFMAAGKSSGSNFYRYDAGSDTRIQSVQPFNEPIVGFKFAYRPV